jgi:hypothetical protein
MHSERIMTNQSIQSKINMYGRVKEHNHNSWALSSSRFKDRPMHQGSIRLEDAIDIFDHAHQTAIEKAKQERESDKKPSI